MGQLTTHVLDTASGKPAAGLPIELIRVLDSNQRESLGQFVTNANGRTDQVLLSGEALLEGIYELCFNVEAYFNSQPVSQTKPPFLDIVTIRFCISHPAEHYHIPLLVSPWSYSTYRGS